MLLQPRDDALGMVPSEHRRRPAINPGGPAGNPCVGHDQQAGGLGGDIEYGAVRVVGQPVDGNERLPMIGRPPKPVVSQAGG